MTSPRRAPLLAPFTSMQETVVELIGERNDHRRVASLLGLRLSTVRYHAREAAAKIPGSLPTTTRIVMWWRGAPLEVLTGQKEPT